MYRLKNSTIGSLMITAQQEVLHNQIFEVADLDNRLNDMIARGLVKILQIVPNQAPSVPNTPKKIVVTGSDKDDSKKGR